MSLSLKANSHLRSIALGINSCQTTTTAPRLCLLQRSLCTRISTSARSGDWPQWCSGASGCDK